MVEIKESKCRCGKCKTEFWVEWDLEITDVIERGMGENIEYHGDIEVECPTCRNNINATLYVSEYPVGALEVAQIIRISDSEQTHRSKVDEPVIAFFDL